VKDMKKILVFLLIVGFLAAGTVCAVQDVNEQVTQEDFDFLNDNFIDFTDGGSTTNGEGGGTGSGVPG
jgi:hypothetical protein